MTKPTLLQTILNRPSQSYTAKLPQATQNSPNRQDLIPVVVEPGQSPSISQSILASASTFYGYPSPDYNVGGAVSPRSPSVDVQNQGSSTHVSSSHASHTSPSTTLPTSLYPSPPPIPPKDHYHSGSTSRSSPSRNIILDVDSDFQQRAELRGTYLSPGGLTLRKPPSFEDFVGYDDDDNESTTDIFYTPNSSPRASLASSTSQPMSYATATTVTRRKVSRRSLKEGLNRQPSHRLANSTSRDGDNDVKQNSSPPSSLKVDPTSNRTPPPTRSTSAQITSTELASSRRTAITQASTSTSTRIAIPSTRTPSRSNSLNHSRTTIDSRSAGANNSPGQAKGRNQSQMRAMATVSMASNTSSMSSNSLDGHSVVFSDLLTESTRATTPVPDGNGVKNSPNKRQGSAAADATKRWVDKAANNAAKATITPMDQHSASPSGSQPRQRPVKSHTYHGLGISSTPPLNANGSDASAFASQTLYHQHQYQQYQRNRDNKNTSVMMSMTAVLEAAEEEELYRHGKKKGGAGSSAWRARQLLRQHQHNGKSSVVETSSNTKSRVDTDLNGKGKEKADDNFVRGRFGGGDKSNGAPLNNGKDYKGKGKEKESQSVTYIKHQPLTSSPLAISSKPLPTLGSAPPLKNSSFLELPMLSRPKLGHRRSRSLGSESTRRYQRSESPASPHASGSGLSMQQDIISPRTAGHPRAHSISHTHASSSTMTGIAGAVDLTALPQSSGDLPSNGTSGYTSLVLPRAPLPLNLDGNATRKGPSYGGLLGRTGDGRIDLTKDGLAQTTMASVEVVRGLGSTTGRKGLMGMLQLPLIRRKTVGAKLGLGAGAGLAESRPEDDESSMRRAAGSSSVLGFTSHRKPPEYVASGSVLVQVWAVGVDGIDGRLLGVRIVPGGFINGSGTSPSPVATSTDRDKEPETRQESHQTNGAGLVPRKTEDKEAKPKSNGTGLKRSLSLRERISRSVSLGRSAGKEFGQQRHQDYSADKLHPKAPSQSPEKQDKHPPFGAGGPITMPEIGYIPGRSFVGRVVECGWEVRDEVLRKGDWVAGLLDIKKCGALTEFVVVDRHRVHRVPQPQLSPANDRVLSALIFSPPMSSSSSSASAFAQHSLTLEELALLPLCGLPAYRAVRTFMYAFSSMRDNPSISSVGRSPEMTKHRHAGHDPRKPINFASYGAMISRLNLGDHEHGRRRRALVLRGHDGIGTMAVQMLVLRGWRVCVHVPFIASPPNVPTTSMVADRFMEEVEERIRKWGAEEVIFDDGEVLGMDEGRGAVVRVMNGLREDGDVFDAILDTVGGKEVREAAERLLRSPARRADPGENINGGSRDHKSANRGMGQFTTIAGDNPERAIPSAGDLFRAGIRSLKFGGGGGGNSSIPSSEKTSSEDVGIRNNGNKGGKVGYAWINISQDLDWEGRDVGETIGSLVEQALEYGIKPWVGAEYATAHGARPNRRVASPTEQPSSTENTLAQDSELAHWEGTRIVPFEKAPDVFTSGGPLMSGGTVVVKIAT